MTREEAIESLRGILTEAVEFENSVCYVTEEDREPLEMAIKALEQEPCDNAVSRQAVIDKKELIELEDGQSFYCISPEDVETLPPVTPQPKIGHWINGDCKGGNCSICGEYYAFYPESGDFNYCPNCGAMMVEPQESEDKCKNCEYYHNPDYTRCHECKAESEDEE